MVSAGQLDQRIRIEVPTTERNELGQDARDWVFLANPWAAVRETQGREFLKGDFQAEERVAFIIRWIEVDSTARVVWQGRIYRIESVTGTRRSGERWLHCVASDGAN